MTSMRCWKTNLYPSTRTCNCAVFGYPPTISVRCCFLAHQRRVPEQIQVPCMFACHQHFRCQKTSYSKCIFSQAHQHRSRCPPDRIWHASCDGCRSEQVTRGTRVGSSRVAQMNLLVGVHIHLPNTNATHTAPTGNSAF